MDSSNNAGAYGAYGAHGTYSTNNLSDQNWPNSSGSASGSNASQYLPSTDPHLVHHHSSISANSLRLEFMLQRLMKPPKGLSSIEDAQSKFLQPTSREAIARTIELLEEAMSYALITNDTFQLMLQAAIELVEKKHGCPIRQELPSPAQVNDIVEKIRSPHMHEARSKLSGMGFTKQQIDHLIVLKGNDRGTALMSIQFQNFRTTWTLDGCISEGKIPDTIIEAAAEIIKTAQEREAGQ